MGSLAIRNNSIKIDFFLDPPLNDFLLNFYVYHISSPLFDFNPISLLGKNNIFDLFTVCIVYIAFALFHRVF